MHTAIAALKSISPYSQSRYHQTDKLERELADAYERRTWRNRLHVNSEGRVFIPPMAFKNSIAEAAKYMSIQIPGKGKATYTKHCEAGILVTEPLQLDTFAADVAYDELFVPADGRRGGSKRVMKCFPRIDSWAGTVTYHIFDDIIDEAAFRRHLEAAGQFIGIGRFRPRNNGYYGRFEVADLKWS